MFKKTSTPLGKSTSGLANVAKHVSRSAKSLIVIFLIFAGLQGHAATYYLTTAGVGAAQTATNWNTGGVGGGGTAASNFTTSGDIFIISNGATFGANTTFASGVSLQITSTGTATLGNGVVLTISGSIDFQGTSSSQITTGASTSGIVISSNANVKSSNVNGLYSTANGATQSINAKAGSGSSLGIASYEFNGAATTMTGLPATVNNLTITTAGTKILAAVVTVNGTLTINSGSTLSDGGFLITLGGDFTNSGTFTSTGGYHCRYYCSPIN